LAVRQLKCGVPLVVLPAVVTVLLAGLLAGLLAVLLTKRNGPSAIPPFVVPHLPRSESDRPGNRDWGPPRENNTISSAGWWTRSAERSEFK
jgi:hypothetical protein